MLKLELPNIKTMKTTLLLATAAISLLSIPCLSHADSVREIVDGAEEQKASKLEAYLKANPDAADRLDGISELIRSLVILEDPNRAFPWLQKKYELLTGGQDIQNLDLNALLPGTVHPMILSLSASGKKEEALALLAKVKKELSGHRMANQVNQFLEQLSGQLNAPSAGDVIEISFTDLNGNKVDLAAMKGKVVLVDFWATWCGPCVAELPNVLEAYKKHHDKGFEIIGISLDQDKAALENFIKERGMPWPQYFDGKGWENSIAQKYSISSIPATFLIGKDGKVTASNLRGEALVAEVARQLAGK